LGSYAYNVYQALTNTRLGPEEFRRWERVAPVFLAQISKAARAWKEEGLTGQTGSKVVRFDPHDPEHMAEVVAMGLGYQPLRVSKTWDRIVAQQEAIAYWDVRRSMLLNQFWAAHNQKDQEEVARVQQAIRKFNQEVAGSEA